jgi:hypothetical protein
MQTLDLLPGFKFKLLVQHSNYSAVKTLRYGYKHQFVKFILLFIKGDYKITILCLIKQEKHIQLCTRLSLRIL